MSPSTAAAPQASRPVAEPAAAQTPARDPPPTAVRSTTSVSGPGTTIATAATARNERYWLMGCTIGRACIQNNSAF